jgi:PHD/YefM family antitoxin component YafN of YafNO toxin-antitoxin module
LKNLIFTIMNIQAEKIELIRLITEINYEKILRKPREILTAANNMDETERIQSNPAMVRRLEESRQQIKTGKGKKVNLDDIWK